MYCAREHITFCLGCIEPYKIFFHILRTFSRSYERLSCASLRWLSNSPVVKWFVDWKYARCLHHNSCEIKLEPAPTLGNTCTDRVYFDGLTVVHDRVFRLARKLDTQEQNIRRIPNAGNLFKSA